MKDSFINSCIIINNFSAGGAEKVLINLCNFTIKKNIKVELIVLNDKGPLKNLLDKKIKVINLNKRKLIFAIPSIVKNLKQKKYNSILTSLPHFNIY